MVLRSPVPASTSVVLPSNGVVDQLDADGLVELATEAARLHTRAMARLAMLDRDRVARGAVGEYLTVDEAAALLRVTPEWVYRKAGAWPFAAKLAPKVLRIQRVGLLRWIDQRSRR